MLETFDFPVLLWWHTAAHAVLLLFNMHPLDMQCIDTHYIAAASRRLSPKLMESLSCALSNANIAPVHSSRIARVVGSHWQLFVLLLRNARDLIVSQRFTSGDRHPQSAVGSRSFVPSGQAFLEQAIRTTGSKHILRWARTELGCLSLVHSTAMCDRVRKLSVSIFFESF